MAPKVTSLLTRIASALGAVAILVGAGYFAGERGLTVISSMMVVLGIFEYARMAFGRFSVSREFVNLFSLASVALYAGLILRPEIALLLFSSVVALFFSLSIWLTRNRLDNDLLLPALGMASLGFLYCIGLPVFAVLLLYLPHGILWFCFLLAIVFFGDTFAFFGGWLCGKRKLMPLISPNKTVEGAAAGLLGSCLAGVLFCIFFFTEVPILDTILFCLVCGFVAQSGDLLMSLVKRVAQVKDSGSIMPGHGGVLDRLDGIFLAAPLVYGFVIEIYVPLHSLKI